mgnify:CR=1 FL=1
MPMTDTENAPHISVGDIDCNNNSSFASDLGRRPGEV